MYGSKNVCEKNIDTNLVLITYILFPFILFLVLILTKTCKINKNIAFSYMTINSNTLIFI